MLCWQAVKECSLKARELEVGPTVGEVTTDQSVDACQVEGASQKSFPWNRVVRLHILVHLNTLARAKKRPQKL